LFDALQVLRPRRMEWTAAIDELCLLVEGLAPAAVKALVGALVDIAARDPPAHEFLDALLVVVVDRRADESIVRDLVDLAQALELSGVAIDERSRRDALNLRG